MTKIDIDKFVASIMKCLCMPHREDAYMCRHWINKALDAQGLKFENGEIVKNQRRVAAEAKEAIFDNEDEEELGIAIHYLQRAGQWNSATWLKSLKTRLGGK